MTMFLVAGKPLCGRVRAYHVSLCTGRSVNILQKKSAVIKTKKEKGRVRISDVC